MLLKASVVLASSMCLAVLSSIPTAQSTGQTLTVGQPLDRGLTSGQTERHAIELGVGQHAMLRMTLSGRDLALTVRDSDGRALIEIPRIRAVHRTRRAFVLAERAGTHVIEVHVLGQGNATATYRLLVEEIVPSTDRHRFLRDGQRAFVEGEQLDQRGTASSIKEALAKYQTALPLWRSGGDAEGEARTLHNIAEMYRRLGDFRRAADGFKEALPAVRNIGDVVFEASVFNGMASALNAIGDPLEALECLRAALTPARAVGDGRTEGIILLSTGQTLFTLSQFQQAMDRYDEALTLFRSTGWPLGEAWTLSALGTAHAHLGNHESALYYLKASLPIFRAEGDRQWEATTLNNIAWSFWRQEAFREAIDVYSQGLQVAQAIGSRRSEATALRNLGELRTQMGDREQALQHYEQALDIGRSIDDPRLQSTVHLSLAAVYHERGDRQKATEHINQALTLGRAVLDRDLEARSLGKRALLELDAGRFHDARATSQEALSILDVLRSRVATPDQRASFSATVRHLYDQHVQILMAAHRAEPHAGHDRIALEAAERARARGFLDRLTEAAAGIRGDVDPALLRQEETLRQRLSSRDTARMRLLSSKPTREQVLAIEEEIDKLSAEHARVEVEIRRRSPRYAALAQAEGSTVTEIQRLLGPDTTLLEYALGDKLSVLWVVTSSKVTSFDLPGRTAINDAARRVYSALTARALRIPGETQPNKRARLAEADRAFPGTAADLSAMVLPQEALALVGRSRLVIVADGALQWVPFGALPVPDPLLVTHEIVTLPSASTLAALRRRPSEVRSSTRQVMVLADPVFGRDDPRLAIGTTRPAEPASRSPIPADVAEGIRSAGLMTPDGTIPRVPFTRLEAQAIGAVVPKGTAQVVLGFEANRAALESAQAARASILHLATHGFLREDRPELSGLILSLVDKHGRSQDGFVRLFDIYNLRLQSDLVILSACQTGLGKDIRGEGLVGLTRGFLHAGAKQVVASLWQIDDAATAEVMRRVYQEMLGPRQRSPAAALRDAQLAVWRQEGFQAPFYWAGFTLHGDWTSSRPTWSSDR